MPNKLLSQEQLNRIDQEANKLLSKNPHSTTQWETILYVLKDQQIELREGDLKEISGMLLKENGQWKIIVNQSDSTTRKLFTIAHELGHYVLHSQSADRFIDGQLIAQNAWNREEITKYSEQELEANEFAASLLMPSFTISSKLKDLRKEDITENIILELANLFGVSSLAVLTRLKNLNYVD